MFSSEERERYNRHFILQEFGEAAQQKLKKAHVLVIGAGGLGCPALLYLAAAGAGCIGIVDDDVVSLSNLQRQVLYTTEDIGLLKVLAAKKRLEALNPSIQINAIAARINSENVLSILSSYDIIVDGTDNFSTRYLLNDATVLLQKPLVYGAIFKFEGQVSVFNLEDGPTYRCLFPSPPADANFLSCSDVGVLGVLPGIIGTWQAVEVIKIITGIGSPLKGKILNIDLINNEVNSFSFTAVEKNKRITELGTYNETCEPLIKEVDWQTLNNWQQEKEVQLLDVREQDEYNRGNIGGQNFPLSQLEKAIENIDPLKLTVVHCQTGVRSKKAIAIITSFYPLTDIYNLKGGLTKI